VKEERYALILARIQEESEKRKGAVLSDDDLREIVNEIGRP